MDKKKWPLYVTVICALIGLLFTYLLMREHHFGPVLKETKETVGIFGAFTSSVCGDDNSYFNCAAVNKSTYSSLAGMPLTSWGMLYFMLSLCMITAMVFLKSEHHKSHAVLYYWYVAAGSVYALVLLLISVTAVRKICPLCMITYGAHWISLAMMSIYLIRDGISPLKIKDALRGLKETAREGDSYKYLIVMLISVIFSTAVGFGTEPVVVMMRDEYIRENKERVMQQSLEKFMKEKFTDIDVKGKHVMGDPLASVTIVEFSDFLCPHCGTAAETLREVLVDNPKNVRVIFMNYPLDTACNPKMNLQLHIGACIAARGALCAARQGKFEQYYNFAFQINMQFATDDKISKIARYVGIDMTRFQSCMASAETKRELDKDMNTASSLGVNGTPKLFINGKLFSGAISRELINRVIKKELERGN
jgi:protein-disulfide isomerase/uncharacterized membrane protein